MEDLFVREIGRPAVGREDRSVEPDVRVLKPGRTVVVEVGERAVDVTPPKPPKANVDVLEVQEAKSLLCAAEARSSTRCG